MKIVVGLGLAGLMLLPAPALGGVRSAVVREAMETIVRRFGKEAAKEGTEALTKRLERLAAQHGPCVIEAARHTGPRALRIIEDAGEHGAVAARLLAHHGEKAVALAGSRRSLTQIARHGDAAAEAMLKHPGIAEPLIETLGKPGMNALNAIGARGGRRLAQMAEDGSLLRIGRTREVLAVLERFGDRAMDFVWRHKGALTVASLLAAFLADPEPFLLGTRDITKILADNAIPPLVAAPAEAVREAARQVNWTLVTTILAGSYLALRCLHSLLPKRRTHSQKDAGELDSQGNCTAPPQ
jgi:hypothetical protein